MNTKNGTKLYWIYHLSSAGLVEPFFTGQRSSGAGYWAFGNKVQSNILFSINHPVWMVAIALFAVSLLLQGLPELAVWQVCVWLGSAWLALID